MHPFSTPWKDKEGGAGVEKGRIGSEWAKKTAAPE